MAFLDKAGLERFWANIVSLVGTKVEKEEGKGLSTEDFTTEEKEKLANITDYVDEAIANIDTNVTVAKITDLTATATELNYMDGVTSNVQTQLDAKVPINRTINGKALSSNITLSASDVSAYSKTEIDSKLSSKADSSHNHSASDINSGTLSSDRLPTVPITKGGTGATTAADALTNLGAMPKSGGTFTGAVTCNSTLKVSGKATMGRIDASNEYLTGSLYVGGKSSTSDGKVGVAFGASGNITMQGSSAPTLNFIVGTATSAGVKLAANSSNQLAVTGTLVGSESARTTRSVFNNETRASSTTGTLQSVKYFIDVT